MFVLGIWWIAVLVVCWITITSKARQDSVCQPEKDYCLSDQRWVLVRTITSTGYVLSGYASITQQPFDDCHILHI
jgi:hypothetical protein